MKNLPQSWKLPDTIKRRFGQRSVGKQRAMLEQGHLLLILHKIPQSQEREREGVFFWRDPQGNWQHSGGGQGLQPLNRHLQTFNDAEEQFTLEYNQAQKAEDYFLLLEKLSPLRRMTKNLYATLQSAREGIPDDQDLISLRDWAYEIDRNLDLLYENSKNALDYSMACRAEEQAKLSQASVEAAHRLNILAAIFFPLTAISCLFGMNIASGFENSTVVNFWGITLFSVVIGIRVRRWVTTGKWL